MAADDGHHGERQHDQADVAVSAVPGATLVVVEAELGLGALEAILDGPAVALDVDQGPGSCAGWAPRGEIGVLAVGQPSRQEAL